MSAEVEKSCTLVTFFAGLCAAANGTSAKSGTEAASAPVLRNPRRERAGYSDSVMQDLLFVGDVGRLDAPARSISQRSPRSHHPGAPGPARGRPFVRRAASVPLCGLFGGPPPTDSDDGRSKEASIRSKTRRVLVLAVLPAILAWAPPASGANPALQALPWSF